MHRCFSRRPLFFVGLGPCPVFFEVRGGFGKTKTRFFSTLFPLCCGFPVVDPVFGRFAVEDREH